MMKALIFRWNEIKTSVKQRQRKYRQPFLGFVFQSFNLISFKNAVENVALSTLLQKVKERKK